MNESALAASWQGYAGDGMSLRDSAVYVARTWAEAFVAGVSLAVPLLLLVLSGRVPSARETPALRGRSTKG